MFGTLYYIVTSQIYNGYDFKACQLWGWFPAISRHTQEQTRKLKIQIIKLTRIWFYSEIIESDILISCTLFVANVYVWHYINVSW